MDQSKIPVPPPQRRLPQLDQGVGSSLKFRYSRDFIQWKEGSGFHGGPRRQPHQIVWWSAFASIVDGLLLLSSSLFFLMSFSWIVRTSIHESIDSFFKFSHASIFMLIFLLAAWLYLLTTRIFFGFTVGEWACDLRMGAPSQRIRGLYPLRVLTRSTLVVGTGLVVIPLISLLARNDIAGNISGIKLMSLR